MQSSCSKPKRSAPLSRSWRKARRQGADGVWSAQRNESAANVAAAFEGPYPAPSLHRHGNPLQNNGCTGHLVAGQDQTMTYDEPPFVDPLGLDILMQARDLARASLEHPVREPVDDRQGSGRAQAPPQALTYPRDMREQSSSQHRTVRTSDQIASEQKAVHFEGETVDKRLTNVRNQVIGDAISCSRDTKEPYTNQPVSGHATEHTASEEEAVKADSGRLLKGASRKRSSYRDHCSIDSPSADATQEEDVDASSSPRARPLSKNPLRRRTVRWSTREVDALIAGVQQQGAGRWASILKGSDVFHRVRTSVDLKDKWRNMTSPIRAQALRTFEVLSKNRESKAVGGGAASNAELIEDDYDAREDACLQRIAEDHSVEMHAGDSSLLGGLAVEAGDKRRARGDRDVKSFTMQSVVNENFVSFTDSSITPPFLDDRPTSSPSVDDFSLDRRHQNYDQDHSFGTAGSPQLEAFGNGEGSLWLSW